MNLHNQHGAALVEMAISITLLVLIVFGTIEFGRALFIKNALTNAAREGARKAVVTKASDVQAKVHESVNNCIPFDKTGLGVKITGTLIAGNPIVVQVTLPFKTVVPALIPQLNKVTLRGESTMSYEFKN